MSEGRAILCSFVAVQKNHTGEDEEKQEEQEKEEEEAGKKKRKKKRMNDKN